MQNGPLNFLWIPIMCPSLNLSFNLQTSSLLPCHLIAQLFMGYSMEAEMYLHQLPRWKAGHFGKLGFWVKYAITLCAHFVAFFSNIQSGTVLFQVTWDQILLICEIGGKGMVPPCCRAQSPISFQWTRKRKPYDFETWSEWL